MTSKAFGSRLLEVCVLKHSVHRVNHNIRAVALPLAGPGSYRIGHICFLAG